MPKPKAKKASKPVAKKASKPAAGGRAKASAAPRAGTTQGPKRATKRGPVGGGGERARLNAVARKKSQDVREIGPLPEVVNWKRRERGRADPEFFHRTYFPNKYKLEFGDPHRLAIRTLADCSENGGQFAFAMMRGGGKTTLAETEALRALLYGLRLFVVFIGATDPLANRAVRRMLRVLETNDLLYEDFPEVCHPIRCLERVNQRCKGQTLNGVPTRMEITDSGLVLPTVEGSPSSGSVIQSYGLTGALKGLNMLAPDGTPFRPDMVLIDDAQTRESAKSPTQTDERERIILDDVMGLAGPETELAAVFLCTPIYPNDLTERFINRERHPEWQGVRTRMVEAMPANTAKLDEYGEFRRNALREGRGRAAVNAYWEANRAELEAGCELAWPGRVKKGDVSAVQTAMNLYLTNPTGFASEYQCEPEALDLGAETKLLDATELAKRVGGSDRFVVPPGCTRLTAFFDLGGRVHWWAVVAWNEHFGGAVVDYGCWPRQGRSVFAASDVRPSLADVFPGMTEPQRVYAGLEAAVPAVLGREYPTAGGGAVRVERCLIDAGDWPNTVSDFIRASPFAGVIYPSKGFARSMTSAGVGGWAPKAGERVGHHWKLSFNTAGRGRQVQFDADEWKTFAWNALTVPLGGPHGLTLYGGMTRDNRPTVNHELLALHLAAEYGTPTPHKGGTFVKWRLRPGMTDNHLFDCVVGAAVAASVCGLTVRADGAKGTPPPPKAKGRKLSDIQRERMAKRGA